MITGYARIIIHSPLNGVEVFEEGHFKNGKQDKFGRVFKMEKTMPKRYYNEYQTYIGWWANTDSGLGIAHTDGNMLKGEYSMNYGFPNDGRSWASPGASEFKTENIDTLYYRSNNLI